MPAPHDLPRRKTQANHNLHTDKETTAPPTQPTSMTTAKDATETTTMSESTKQQQCDARQERLTAKHWDTVTKQWQRGTLNKRARTGAEPGAHGHQRSIPLQTSITRFMTKAQSTTGRKRDTRKRKKDTEVREARPQRATPERDDTAASQTDTDTEELPTTQETKRQKMDRTGIG